MGLKNAHLPFFRCFSQSSLIKFGNEFAKKSFCLKFQQFKMKKKTLFLR
ncbi:hypothetical protein UMN179_01576 [Gallibacterium anatis UMN179]|uniref:Uncharacterized protein n=1 Tax=Gallibacterium anatis (strain UMN179) TaxID=1005058 RepID=F4HBV5_GALAU|nr:hypothetical protein UMN179_01576 [Gallibacterium anatis UMN179]